MSSRFLSFLQSKGHIAHVPFLAKQWTILSNGDACMYSSSLHKLSSWEMENCPWWIDMAEGHVLARERELHSEVKKKDTSAKSLDQRREEGPTRKFI